MVEKLPAIADKDIGFILKNTGMTLLSSVGGASGPLFGTFFIRAAQATQARQSLTLEELYQMFRDGADGVISRGKPNLAIKPCVMCGCRWWNRYVSPASKISLFRWRSKLPVASPNPLHKVRLRCKPAKARASYLGERSIGHQDPGATSVMFMMQMLALAAKE